MANTLIRTCMYVQIHAYLFLRTDTLHTYAYQFPVYSRCVRYGFQRSPRPHSAGGAPASRARVTVRVKNLELNIISYPMRMLWVAYAQCFTVWHLSSRTVTCHTQAISLKSMASLPRALILRSSSSDAFESESDLLSQCSTSTL